MYVVNTRVAENGRRLVKIREFYGRVLAHGIAPEIPDPSHFSVERMKKEKDAFVAARGGTVKVDPKNDDALIPPVLDEDEEEDNNATPTSST